MFRFSPTSLRPAEKQLNLKHFISSFLAFVASSSSFLFFYWKFMNESVEIEKESFSLAFLSPHHHVHVLHDAVFDVFCLSVKKFLELNKTAPDALTSCPSQTRMHFNSTKWKASEIMMRWSWNAHHHIINFLLDAAAASHCAVARVRSSSQHIHNIYSRSGGNLCVIDILRFCHTASRFYKLWKILSPGRATIIIFLLISNCGHPLCSVECVWS